MKNPVTDFAQAIRCMAGRQQKTINWALCQLADNCGGITAEQFVQLLADQIDTRGEGAADENPV